ncbi:MAG TPA: DNA methylase [Clostridiales bacterium]|nr:DNA methylase [Clostridiales bacterium]
MLDFSRSFIEVQFPVSKVSKESYKERMSNLGQTLTGLGKWWGRKPLVLVRAAILGILLPVSDNLEKDREIFLKLMTMDEDGLILRKFKNLTQKELYELADEDYIKEYMELNDGGMPVYKRGLTKEEKEKIQIHVFNGLSYDDKLKYCNRPEHIENLPENVWCEINAHLETHADSFQSLIEELGIKRFGHRPKIGDVFSGGGSIPFEAARLGADVFASDLNPVASILTWAALNIAGADDEEIEKLREFQKDVYDEVDKLITEWGIEHNEEGHRADSYLYCMETTCPECGYKVPLAPSWVIGKGTKTVAILIDNGTDGFNIDIVQGANKEKFKESDKSITVRDNYMYCPHCELQTPITSIRGDRQGENGETISGLRFWEKDEFIPRDTDVFQERLYCIRYVKEYTDEKGNKKTKRYYTAPTKEDLQREEKVIKLLKERFKHWQDKGYIPLAKIEEGDKTSEPIRTRGWQFWHQLFNPRQLLINGLFAKISSQLADGQMEKAIGILGLNKCCDWNSKLCIWNAGSGTEKTQNTFTTQALNTLYNYGARATNMYINSWLMNINSCYLDIENIIETKDARNNTETCDLWITDPPYADAVNYHELTEFFLAWNKTLLKRAFPEWYTDSKRVLAVKGTGESFNNSMIEIYNNLNKHMPDNGVQVVMFTHQDVKVWAELAMILWSSGLRVVSAWTISTETTNGGLKSGNYVSGTVLLTLKKQTSQEKIYKDDLYDEITYEVKNTIDSMKDINDKDDPDFNDADFILASYAAALKAITSYKEIAGIYIPYWLAQGRDSAEINPIVELISKAQDIAYNYLIPEGFDTFIWRELSKEERFFIRGLELEMDNIYKIGDYQELARGFGVTDYTDMFYSTTANKTRFKTADEFKRRHIGGDGFGSTLARHLLVAINDCINENKSSAGVAYLKSIYQENNEYWKKKNIMIELLNFISRVESIGHMEHWKQTGYFAKVLREALRNDGV